MHRTVGLALSAVLVVGLCSAGAAAASVVDPVGTITLASGDSPYGAQRDVLGGSAEGVVFADVSNSTVQVRGAGGQLTTFASAGPGVDVSGDLIVGWDYNTGDINYQSIDGSIQGTATYDVSTQYVVGASATGWVLQNRDADENPTTLVHVLAATKQVTTLAAPPNGYSPQVGPDGVAFAVSSGADTEPVAYTSFASPGVSTVIGSCDGSCDFFDIDGSAVLWQGQDGKIVRQPLDGSPTTPIDPPVGAFSASMTDSHIAINDCNQPSNVYTVPFSGGSWTKLAGPMAALFSCGIGDDGATFLLATSTQAPAAQAGIYSFPTAAAQPSLFIPVGAKPIEGKSVAVGAGRATWVDDARADKPVWNRSLSGSGNALTAGAPSLVATHATSFGLSVSGRRTVFTHEDGTAALVTGNGTATTIDDHVEWFLHGGVAQVSGTRVLARHDFNTWRVHDLVSGTSTDLVAAGNNGVRAASLWGNTLAYSTLENFPGSGATVAIRNLTTGATTTAASASPLYNEETLSPAHPSGVEAMGGVVSTWGDSVAWDETTISLVDPTCDPKAGSCDTTEQTVVKYRDFRSMGAVQTLAVDPTTTLSDLAVTSSRVIPVTEMFDDAGGGMVLTLTGATLGAATTTQLAQLPFSCCSFGSMGRRLSIDGTTVGWLGEDKRPKVLSWEADTARPRFLGNPVAPTTFDPATTAWNAEWVFSKPLPICTVSIRNATIVVRTLGCATTDGSAVVAWDGKDDDGSAVADGTYTWTVTAGDSTGAALNVDGSAGAITGSVHVASGPPPPVATTLTSHISATALTYGAGVTLSGVLTRAGGTPVPGAAIAVQTKASGATAWSALSTVHTSVSGGWTITTKPGVNRSYRAVYAGDAADKASTSAAVSVTVRPTITLKLSKKKVRLGAKVKFKGTVAPQHKGQSVRLQRLKGSKWVTKKAAKLNSKSQFSIAWKTDSKKNFFWRVILPKHSDHAAGVSPSRKLKVK